MSIQKLLLLIFASLFFHPTIFGQKRKIFFESYESQINNIMTDSTFQKVVLSNEKYGHVTGYFKNGSFSVIANSYKQSYGTSECIFLFKKNSLVFVNKKEINTMHETKTRSCIDTLPYIKFEGRYQFVNNKIVNKNITGQQNEKKFDLGESIRFKENSAIYFIFHANKEKLVLSKKKEKTAANKSTY